MAKGKIDLDDIADLVDKTIEVVHIPKIPVEYEPPVPQANWKLQPEPPLNVTLNDLTFSGCKFPVTRASPFLFCGHENNGKGVYCEAHHQACYTAPPKMREKKTDTTLKKRFNRF